MSEESRSFSRPAQQSGVSFFADILSQLKEIKLSDHSRQKNPAKNNRISDKKPDSSRGGPRGRARGAPHFSSSSSRTQTRAGSFSAPSVDSSPYDRDFWDSLLQQLNTQSYPDVSLQREDAASIVVLLAEQLPRAVPSLSLKYCEFLVALLRKQDVGFHVSAELDEVLGFLLPLLTLGSDVENSSRIQLEALKAISFLVFERGWLLLGKFAKLIETLSPLLDDSKVDRDVFRMSVNCLGNLCAKVGNKGAQYYPAIFNLLSLKFSKYSSDLLLHSQQYHLGKTVASLLRALQLVILEAKSLHEAQFASFMSALSKLIYYGTSNLPLPPPPAPTSAEPNSASGSRRASPASSEYSGSDANGSGDRFNAWKVRLHALGCLQSMAKSSAQKFVPFWPNVLPQSSQQPSICSIMISDPVHQVRSAACSLLSVILDGQKTFLTQAITENTGTSTSGGSFTAMSSRLATIIREIHSALCKAIDGENRPTTLVQIIKCVVVIVTNTPYENMQRGLLSSLANRLTKLYNSHPPSSTSTPDSVLNMQRSALSCLAAVVASVKQDFSQPKSAKPSVKSAAEEVQTLLESTILAQIVSELKTNAAVALQPELLRVLASISGSFFDLVSSIWSDVFSIVLKSVEMSLDTSSLPATDPAAVRLGAVKVIEDSTASMLARVESDASEAQKYSSLWDQILHSPLLTLVTDRSSQVRSSMCNVLSQIPGPIFASLKHQTRIMCITLMLGAARDDSPVVRSQACRTLGVYILNSSVNIDPIFVTDVAESLVEAMKDPNLNVRIRACWSLANLCDALVGLREGEQIRAETPGDDLEDHSSTEDIPRDALIMIARCALVAAKDNDKVRSNAVRALGNFTRFASARLFSEEQNTLELFNTIIKSLIDDTSEGSAKVRWNACYALGNLFRNESILEFSKSSVSTAMETLLSLLATASNFKIRINACVALASPASLDYYGNRLNKVWKVVSECLDTLDTLEDVASYQYKDSLYEQLIRVTLHLVELHGKASKLIEMSFMFPQLLDYWTAFWKRFSSPFFRRPKASADDGAASASVSGTIIISCLNRINEALPVFMGTAEEKSQLESKLAELLAEINLNEAEQPNE